MIKPNAKRKLSEEVEEENKEVRASVKYIGETSRSGYERLKEHYKDLENISVKSHMLKHYFEKHKNKEVKDMRFSVKVLRTYYTAFERQIGESIYINHNLKIGNVLLNSKNEYNRCIIPRLAIDLKDEIIEDYEENEKERKIRQEIQAMKEKMRYEKEIQKKKKIKLMDIEKVNNKSQKKKNGNSREEEEEKVWENHEKENKLLKLRTEKEKMITKVKSQK